ncbi:MAG TPA: N-acetyltransferase [Aliiroseovarius sp.]|nr:N-acetyltransferase [Aliiroseovarius sp.]
MQDDLPIFTRRLTLRPLTRADIPPLVEMLNDFEVSRWLSVVPYPYTRDDAREFLTFLESADPLDALGIEAREGLVGVVGISPGATSGLGYWLGRAHHGKGYMSEAARALVSHYFATRDADHLTSGYFENNTASARVLEKLGFIPNGHERVNSVAQDTEVLLKKVILPRELWEALSWKP